MVTNQIMQRRMGNLPVLQRTKDGFFNATSLLNAWNANNGMQKQMTHYLGNSSTKEFVDTIMEREGIKERNSVYTSSRGVKGTWMHPMLFIDFAMWINPSYRYDVLKFVFDQMLKFRDDAGEAYKQMSSAVASIVPSSFMPQAMSKLAQAINHIVFKEHYPNVRNDHGSEEEMQELFLLERRIADTINDGFVRDFESLIAWLRKVWAQKQMPKALQ